LLIDIQAKLQQGYGAGFENWVRINNIKEMSKTLLYLKEKGIDSYDDLVAKASAASAEFASRNTKIKAFKERMKAITELQKHIGTYGKTRDVYREYNAIKNPKQRDKFYEEHRADISLHEAAKNYFDAQGYGKDNKLPTVASLKQEWAMLAAEKKKLYSGYREAKAQMIDLLTAKSNADKILGITSAKNANRSQSRSSPHDR
jgi:hypothetical protein